MSKCKNQTIKQVEQLKYNLKKISFVNLFLAALGAHFFTIMFLNLDVWSLKRAGISEIEIDWVFSLFSGANLTFVFIIAFLILFLLLTFISVGFIQFKILKGMSNEKK